MILICYVDQGEEFSVTVPSAVTEQLQKLLLGAFLDAGCRIRPIQHQPVGPAARAVVIAFLDDLEAVVMSEVIEAAMVRNATNVLDLLGGVPLAVHQEGQDSLFILRVLSERPATLLSGPPFLCALGMTGLTLALSAGWRSGIANKLLDRQGPLAFGASFE